jgi:hypothetical protein
MQSLRGGVSLHVAPQRARQEVSNTQRGQASEAERGQASDSPVHKAAQRKHKSQNNYFEPDFEDALAFEDPVFDPDFEEEFAFGVPVFLAFEDPVFDPDFEEEFAFGVPVFGPSKASHTRNGHGVTPPYCARNASAFPRKLPSRTNARISGTLLGQVAHASLNKQQYMLTKIPKSGRERT